MVAKYVLSFSHFSQYLEYVFIDIFISFKPLLGVDFVSKEAGFRDARTYAQWIMLKRTFSFEIAEELFSY